MGLKRQGTHLGNENGSPKASILSALQNFMLVKGKQAKEEEPEKPFGENKFL